MALREQNEEPASLKIAQLHYMNVTYLLVAAQLVLSSLQADILQQYRDQQKSVAVC